MYLNADCSKILYILYFVALQNYDSYPIVVFGAGIQSHNLKQTPYSELEGLVI